MEHGVVYHRNIPKCMFVVQLGTEKYSVFESYDITAFNVGDKIYGNFSAPGPNKILHAETLKWYSINVQDVCSDASIALEKANIFD